MNYGKAVRAEFVVVSISVTVPGQTGDELTIPCFAYGRYDILDGARECQPRNLAYTLLTLFHRLAHISVAPWSNVMESMARTSSSSLMRP